MTSSVSASTTDDRIAHVERQRGYSGKTDLYFNGERRDLIDRLGVDPHRSILEVGCGDGATGLYARQTGRCGRYVGVELSPRAARVAAAVLDDVHVGNIEEMAVLPTVAGGYDVVIASEVLEHLVDPWETLRRVRALMKPGGTIFASSPNVSHRSIVAMLLRGGWDLSDEGHMDRTHLRWFTPRTYAAMFRETGYDVLAVWPMRTPGRLARLAGFVSKGRLSHLFISQIVIEARAK